MKTPKEFYKEKYDIDIPNTIGWDMIKAAREYASPQPAEKTVVTEEEIDKATSEYVESMAGKKRITEISLNDLWAAAIKWYQSHLQPQIITEDSIIEILVETGSPIHEGYLVNSNQFRSIAKAITALQGKEQRGEEWISVKDQLPKVSGYYWITFGGTYVRKIFYTEAVKVWGVGEQVYPVYWKPYVEIIPPPPNPKK
ncbi:MAG: hypothetical protein KAS04_03970 [Candidatus Aenigmarchaeota archaeon]|nr:hypothetical protein [Candidatus Aenigmarchaeota archaeon]